MFAFHSLVGLSSSALQEGKGGGGGGVGNSPGPHI